jgi:hypothetical protein
LAREMKELGAKEHHWEEVFGWVIRSSGSEQNSRERNRLREEKKKKRFGWRESGDA